VIFKGAHAAGNKPSCERGTSKPARDHRLRDGKTFCMLLKTLDAEKLLANELAIIPWQLRLSASEYAADKHLQSDLSFALSR
jgi:hypothetical protein